MSKQFVKTQLDLVQTYNPNFDRQSISALLSRYTTSKAASYEYSTEGAIVLSAIAALCAFVFA